MYEEARERYLLAIVVIIYVFRCPFVLHFLNYKQICMYENIYMDKQ